MKAPPYLWKESTSVHKFHPSNAARLESADRYAMLPPAQILETLGLAEGMTCLDVGAGTGYFTRAAAALIGTAGRVFAVDTSPDMLVQFRERGVPPNCTILLSEEDSIPLPDGIADFILVAFVFHETHDRERFLGELARLLKPGGRIALVEWKRQKEERGPPFDDRVDAADIRCDAPALSMVDTGDVNDSHYYVVLQPTRLGDAKEKEKRS
jgi:ubiquinone/menaquinone biosynthesis C-methylase UbiE